MIEIRATGSIGGDETYPYDVVMDRPYTVREFIDEAVSHADNWGCIRVSADSNERGKVACWYRHGECEEPMVDCLESQVKSACGYGGWSLYNFTLVV